MNQKIKSNQQYVLNAEGEKEPFSSLKVYRSAARAGASKDLARNVANSVQKEIYPGIQTFDIEKKVQKSLSRENLAAGLRFNLKQGMRKLGPTGFPFERYIGKIFSGCGFDTAVNKYISGHCIRYEIDFLAKKGNSLYIGECKYRNLAGGRVDLKIALANYARFLDLKNSPFLKKVFFSVFHQKMKKSLKIKSIIVTNTKFTSKAIKYCDCVGVELLGWKCPRSAGLESLIDNQGLYPITILPSLKKFLADIFISKKIVLAKDLLKINSEKFAKKFKIQNRYLDALIKEAKILFGY